MSGKPTAGTFRLDGMLRGPTPDPHTVQDIESWVATARKGGCLFHLSVDGAEFSLVPDPAAQPTSKLPNEDLDTILAEGLESLLKLLPPESLPSVFSTLRSEQFHPGEAIQTVYALSPDGTVNTEQRTVDVQTEDPPPELTFANVKKAIIPTLLIVVVLLFISSFFINYSKLRSEAKDTFVPLKKEEVTIENKSVSDYIVVDLTDVEKGKMLHFEIKRGPKWDSALTSKPSDTG